MSQETRKMTDDDIKALADELEGRLVKRFYFNIGRGVWGVIWRALIGLIVLIAAYGSVKGGKWW